MNARLRRLMPLAVMLTTFAGAMTAEAGVASATATSCTAYQIGRTCAEVRGSGARVDEVRISRRNLDAKSWWVCNYSADVSVLDRNNRAHVKWFAHPSHVGCDYSSNPQLTQGVHRVFTCGDVVSVRWYDDAGSSGFMNRTLC